jgi:hypothetical protein
MFAEGWQGNIHIMVDSGQTTKLIFSTSKQLETNNPLGIVFHFLAPASAGGRIMAATPAFSIELRNPRRFTGKTISKPPGHVNPI